MYLRQLDIPEKVAEIFENNGLYNDAKLLMGAQFNFDTLIELTEKTELTERDVIKLLTEIIKVNRGEYFIQSRRLHSLLEACTGIDKLVSEHNELKNAKRKYLTVLNHVYRNYDLGVESNKKLRDAINIKK